MAVSTDPLAALSPDKAALLSRMLPPLSFAQESMWLAQQLEPGDYSYNVPVPIRISGPLKVPSLNRSLTEVRRRHAVLRTVFPIVDGRPVQIVKPARTFAANEVDLLILPPPAREFVLRRILTAENRRPFKLTESPGFRAMLVRADNESTLVYLTLHHCVFDQWSRKILLDELGALYHSYATGTPAHLPRLEIRYADYARWQRGWLRDGVLTNLVEFWRQHLEGAPAALELPLDRPRPQTRSRAGAEIAVSFSRDFSEALRQFSNSEGVTLFMTLLAGFQLLLGRYAGQDRVVVGTAVSGRNRRELEPLIGCFINPFPLHTDLSGNPNVRELLARVREVCLSGYAHADLPFEMLVDELSLPRVVDRAPVFSVLFVLQNVPEAAGAPRQLTATEINVKNDRSRLDLTMVLRDWREGITGSLAYDSDLFDQRTVEQIRERLEYVLRQFVENPERRLSEISLLTAAEREQMLVEWNNTAADRPDSTAVRQFESWAHADPQRTALVCGSQQFSYAELDRLASAVSRRLRVLGVGPECRVGVCAAPSPAPIAALLGVWKAGAAWVPLQPGEAAQRCAWMLQDAGATVLLCDAAQAAHTPAGVRPLILEELLRDDEAPAETSVPVGPENLAYVMYTSGSTGRPKGVMITHGGLGHYLHWAAQGYAAAAPWRTVLHSPISFDLSVTALWGALTQGGSVQLVAPEGTLEGLRAALEQEEPWGLVKLTPGQLQLLGAEGLAAAAGGSRVLVVGGEALQGEQVRWWQEQFPETRMYNEYGPTETVVGCCVQQLEPAAAGGRVPIGRPIANTQLYFVDGGGQPAPMGVAGELYIGGAGLARGYHGRADLTAERFVPDPFGPPGGRLYRSGDLARYRPDGAVEYLGRADQQVKIRGYRIEPGEVEAALLGHPGVREAAVVARAGEDGGSRLVAYVAGAALPGVSQWWNWLRERLPEYMIPAAFVDLERLPLTPNGKLDRRALPEPDGARPALENQYVAPGSAAEQALAGIWQAVLGRQRVGIQDNFFALGGDSILSIQVIARAAQAGWRLSPRQLFQHQTIAALAAVAEPAQAAPASAAAEPGAPAPLTPIQRWYLDSQPRDAAHFQQAAVFEPRRPLPLGALERILAALVEHHEALRLRFTRVDGQWRQQSVAQERARLCAQVDLSALGGGWQAALLQRAAAGLHRRGMDLAHGPLLRALLLQPGGGQRPRLLLSIHHLAVDGVSWRILLDDLQQVWAALAAGGPVALPARTTPYTEWARRLEEYACSAALQADADWWRSQAAAAAQPLPCERNAGDNDNASLRSAGRQLSAARTAQLLQGVGQRYRTNAHTLLLAALGAALAEWAGGPVRVELEGHGREDELGGVDLSRTVGWFTTLYPLLLPGGGPPRQWLAAVRQLLDSVPRRGFSYGLLGGRVAAAPAQVLFNYLGQFDSSFDRQSWLRPAGGAAGALRSPRAARTHLLEATALAVGGRLGLTLGYSAARHGRQTMETLAERWQQHLEQLLDYCLEAPEAGLVPADFPLARIAQAELDGLAGTARDIEDLYPLSPMQQGLLFHTLAAPQSGLYTTQVSCSLRDPDVSAFINSWTLAMQRHEALRTDFVWAGLEVPHQVVHSSRSLPVERLDWTTLPASERSIRFERYLEADRARGFDLGTAPLMRLVLIRMNEHEHRLVWSHHHALLDGWSVRELIA